MREKGDPDPLLVAEVIIYCDNQSMIAIVAIRPNFGCSGSN
jgi:hypothetical protein